MHGPSHRACFPEVTKKRVMTEDLKRENIHTDAHAIWEPSGAVTHGLAPIQFFTPQNKHTNMMVPMPLQPPPAVLALVLQVIVVVVVGTCMNTARRCITLAQVSTEVWLYTVLYGVPIPWTFVHAPY